MSFHCESQLIELLSLISAADARVEFTTERAARETEVQMLASSGDPMLP